MLYSLGIMSTFEVLTLVVCMLFSIAFVTVAESKTMASMQSSLGPNMVGFYGLLQAFADALKLLLKEYISPTQSNMMLFFMGPIMTLIFSLLGYAVMPLCPGISMFDFNLGVLYLLAVSSLSTYGMLLAGWSANSKYAFLGSLSSTAQLISYELMLSSAILLVILLTGSLNLSVMTESQSAIWFMLPLFPVFMIFFMGSVAETNSAPFDLAEAESELVSGFMTEHAAVMFVFFFLAEYGSMVLMCMLTSMLFIGGYLINMDMLFWMNFMQYINFDLWLELNYHGLLEKFFSNVMMEGLICSLILGLKSSMMVFIFMWVSASFPSMRFDQLMSFCWTVLLPMVISIIILVPCVMYIYDLLPNNIILL